MAALTAKKEKQFKVIETSISKLETYTDLSYHRYLERLLEQSQEFTEVKDIIARYDTLSATNTELISRSQAGQEKMEQDRLAFLAAQEVPCFEITQEKNNTILNYNNKIAKLQTRLEEVQILSTKSQAKLDLNLSTASQKSLLLGQIKMHS